MEQINHLQTGLSEITETMKENIYKLMVQQESLEELNEKTELLVENSKEFNSRSSHLKRQLWWAKNKIPLIIGGVLTSSTAATIAFCLL